MADKQLNTPGSLFLNVLRPTKTIFTSLMVAAVAIAACELSIPWLLEKIIDLALTDNAAHQRLNYLGLAMVGVIVVLYGVHAVYLRMEIRMTSEGGYRVRKLVYEHIIRQPIAYFNRKPTGELIHRSSNDTDVFESNLTQILSDLPFEVLTIFGVTVMMSFLDVWLTVIVVVFLVVTSSISAYLGKPLPVLERKVQIVGARFSARLQETINGVKTVKAFVQESREMDKLDQASRQKTNLQCKEGKVHSWIIPIFDLMELLGVVVVVWYGAHLVLDGTLTPGGLVAFIAYMEILAGPVSRLGSYYKRAIETFAVSTRIAEFLNDEEPAPETRFENGTGRIPDSNTPIVFENVSFQYPNHDLHALKQINLTVDSNELVAIVGRNGSGKSTMMDLLQRLHAPREGRVLAGDIDLREWDQEAWRSQLGVMSQEVFLFNSSIEDNIRYSCPTCSQAELDRAVESAGLGKMLETLPKGIKTVVGEKGSRLSGGQRQRIALARLFLRDPTIVIYDEPTAALDGEAAKEIASQMLHLCKGRVSFLITHQSDMIKLAHRIVLLDAGKIVAIGTHDELFITQPLYRLLLESMQDYQKRQTPKRVRELAVV